MEAKVGSRCVGKPPHRAGGLAKAGGIGPGIIAVLGLAHEKEDILNVSAICRQQLLMLARHRAKSRGAGYRSARAGARGAGNANQLKQVLTNLVTNAAEANE